MNDKNRRDFMLISGNVCFASFIALELGCADPNLTQETIQQPNSASNSDNTESKTQSTSATDGYIELDLLTTHLNELQEFYSNVIGWKVDRSKEKIVIASGHTKITFRQPNSLENQPFYHIAWSIPESKFDQAKTWLQNRTQLLKAEDGRDEIRMGGNRRGLYFEDPSHNILELIARGNVKDDSAGPFQLTDIISVNHFGIVVQDVLEEIKKIKNDLDLPEIGQSTAQFARLGNELRHVVLVPKQRLWFPERKYKSMAYPAKIVIPGTKDRESSNREFAYSIKTQRSN